MKKKVIKSDILFNSRLTRKFFNRNTLFVAKNLLGKLLIRKFNGKILCGRIVETEAYTGFEDHAAHSFNGMTKRNEVMFNGGGFSYVYYIYGNHYCFNATAGKEGSGHAVLIRAVEPLVGIETMKRFRKCESILEISNGPGKLTQAFRIDKKLNGYDLTESNEIFIARGSNETFKIAVSKRIGIKKAAGLPYRFFIKGNLFVTRHKFNRQADSIV